MEISQAFRSHLIELGFAQKTFTDNASFAEAALKALAAGKVSAEKWAELQGEEKGGKSPTPSDVFGGARVKRPSERYSSVKSVAKHARTGMPVRDERGREVETVSELEHAKAGAFLKHLAARSGQPVALDEHDRELVAEMFDADSWCGKIGSQYETGIAGARVKALLSDSTSGGAELVPEWFDTAVIQFPLLHSELLPRIDLRDVPRGRSVEGASVGNPSVVWGVPEGTPMTPFDTSSLVAAIDTTIHPVTCAVEIGRDFLSDAAVDVGRVLVENIGQRMLAELDRVIVKGNGSTEPAGIFGTSGMNDIGNPAGGSGADPQVNDFEALMFAVGKQYRTPANRCAFISNDTSYRRAMAIAVGASDARRVFGMLHQNYEILSTPYLIQNDLANTHVGFGALAKYRLYRRQGQEVRFTDQGRELALKNQTLLVVRGRYGGKVVDANAFSFTDNAKA